MNEPSPILALAGVGQAFGVVRALRPPPACPAVPGRVVRTH